MMRPDISDAHGGQLRRAGGPAPAAGSLSEGQNLALDVQDVIAVATRAGVKLIDLREHPLLRTVELTPAEWRAMWPRIEAAMVVCEGRHPAQIAQAQDAAAD